MPRSRSYRHLAVCLLFGPALWACADDAATDGDASLADSLTDHGPIGDSQTTDIGKAADAGSKDGVGVDAGINCPNDCAGIGADPNKCQVATCDPATGTCKLGLAPAGAACDDGKSCTAGDNCTAQGACVGTVSCPTEGPCEQAACGSDGACTAHSRSGPCNDGNPCTTGDTCLVQTCIGKPMDPTVGCDDGKACTDDECEPGSGCSHLPSSATQACDDGDPCTQVGHCDGVGGCQIGPPAMCDDGDPCTADSCKPGPALGAGCVAVALPEGATCSDASKCTQGDVCSAGQCIGELIDNAKPSTTCTTLNCDPKSAEIAVSYAAIGTQCSDGDACTVADVCNAGVCKGGDLLCNDGNSCTVDACDPATGLCASTKFADGAPCDDINDCTSSDACGAGVCTGKGFQDTGQCADGNTCTADGCAPQGGCFYLPSGVKPCDDGDGCTVLDVCGLGLCKGKAKGCDDNNPCTKDGCKVGACTHLPFLGPCDDGDLCTTAEVCLGGKCGGKPANCGDDNACTKDDCNAKTGCSHLPLPGGTPCDDGVSCTQQDQCDGVSPRVLFGSVVREFDCSVPSTSGSEQGCPAQSPSSPARAPAPLWVRPTPTATGRAFGASVRCRGIRAQAGWALQNSTRRDMAVPARGSTNVWPVSAIYSAWRGNPPTPARARRAASTASKARSARSIP